MSLALPGGQETLSLLSWYVSESLLAYSDGHPDAVGSPKPMKVRDAGFALMEHESAASPLAL